MRIEGAAITGGTVQGQISLPRPTDRRTTHTPTRRKASGLDWSAIRPSCKTCGTSTSALDREDRCTSCAPRSTPAAAPAPPRRPAARRPAAPRRAVQRTSAGGQPPDVGSSSPVGVGSEAEVGAVPPADPRPAAAPGPRAPRPDKIQLDGPAVAAAYLAGATLRELAHEHDVSSPTIARTLDEQGVVRRKQRVDYSPELIGQVRALYVDEQLDQQQVAQRLGVTLKVVQTAMTRGEIPPRESASARSQRGIGHPNKISPEGAEQILTRYRAGEAGPQLAAEFGVAAASIYHLLNRHGVPRHGRRTPGLGSDGSTGLRQRIHDLGVTPRDINRWARETGLVELPKPGLPSAVVVDAWAAAHAGPA